MDKQKVTLRFVDVGCEFYCDIECSVWGTPLEYVQDNWSTHMLTIRTNPCPKCTQAAPASGDKANVDIAQVEYRPPLVTISTKTFEGSAFKAEEAGGE